MPSEKTQKDLFKFLNANKIEYIATRGYDSKSVKEKKDLDILISKKDFEKIRGKHPKIKRPIDFYIEKESHAGITFVSNRALRRRKFDAKRGFFVLHHKDQRRMNFLRKILYAVRKTKKVLGLYENGVLNVLKKNYRLFGSRYILWDLLYQPTRKLHKTINKEVPKKEELIEKNINGYKMLVNRNGKGIHRDLYLNNIREPVSTKIVEGMLQKGDIALEAGANIGYYALLESKKIGPSGKVYAIEPVKKNFELLQKNITLNNAQNISSHRLAFSNKNKPLTINIAKDSNLSSPAAIESDGETEKIKATTLDTFLQNKRKPTFMRMDIEGYEHIVFAGAKKTLQSLQTIFVELHFPMIKKEKMIAMLKDLQSKGFEIYRAVLEWERSEDERYILGKLTNYLYKKRSKPVVYKDLTIDKLIASPDFLEGHLCLEVFFTKKTVSKESKV